MGSALDWSEPVTTLTEPYWPAHLAKHWEWILVVTEGLREDAIGAQFWAEACRVLDNLIGPESTALVNERWREFVVHVWRMYDDWRARVAKRAAYRRPG